MKTIAKYWVIFLVFAVQVFLGVSPLIPQTRGLWHLADAAQFNGSLAVVLGLEIAAVTLVFGVLFQRESSAFRSEVLETLPRAVIRWLPDRVFYTSFLAAVEEAKHTVRISYLSPTPPDAITPQFRRDYYKSIKALMKQRSDVQFYRIVRHTPANRAWLLELIRDFTNIPNVSLAIVRDDLPAHRVMPLALSVQIIDSDKAWVVAVESHERMREFRDLFVESTAFADAMTHYHMRLWDIADALLENGRPTGAATALAREVDP